MYSVQVYKILMAKEEITKIFQHPSLERTSLQRFSVQSVKSRHGQITNTAQCNCVKIIDHTEVAMD
jgi:hypothetical protein